MHLGDSIFIFILALVLFGPKKLPEMAKQIGKLMAEFRRASTDFRLQIDEELRTMERQEQIVQQKKQEDERASPTILPPELAAESEGALRIMPPNLGEQVSAGTPYAVSASDEEPAQPEDHALLRVEAIPADPADASGTAPTGLAAAEANAARLTTRTPPETTTIETEQATLHTT